MSHGQAELGESTPQSVFYKQGRFGRLFPALQAFAADTALMRDALTELGAKKGPMDADDDLSDPITLITDPAKSANNPNNPTMTAGFTFLGQFIDHDMTFDPTSSLARQQVPESIRNFRLPALDLDNSGGGSRTRSPLLIATSALSLTATPLWNLCVGDVPSIGAGEAIASSIDRSMSWSLVSTIRRSVVASPSLAFTL